MGNGRVSLAPELLQQWERCARHQSYIRDLRFSNRRFADIGITNLEIGNEAKTRAKSCLTEQDWASCLCSEVRHIQA